MSNFKANNKGELVYMPPIKMENLESIVTEFFEMLDGMPDPVFRWYDERLPHESSGPNTWSVDLENDQETAFIFNVSNLELSEAYELFERLEASILDPDYQNLSFDDAWFNRTYYAHVRFVPRSAHRIMHMTYHVYWEVAK